MARISVATSACFLLGMSFCKLSAEASSPPNPPLNLGAATVALPFSGDVKSFLSMGKLEKGYKYVYKVDADGPPGLAIDPDTGVVRWVPSLGAPDSVTFGVSISVLDSKGSLALAGADKFSIVVKPLITRKGQVVANSTVNSADAIKPTTLPCADNCNATDSSQTAPLPGTVSVSFLGSVHEAQEQVAVSCSAAGNAVDLYVNGVKSTSGKCDGDTGTVMFDGSNFRAASVVSVCPQGSTSNCDSTKVVEIKRYGDLARAIVGIHQVGASGTDSHAKLFLDFFLDRPMFPSFRSASTGEPWLRAWFDMRIASAPVQVSTLSAKAIGSSVKGLSANQLAQTGEGLVGVDLAILPKCCALWGQTEDEAQRFRMSWILGTGISGYLSDIKSTEVSGSTYVRPDTTYPNFTTIQDSIKGPNLSQLSAQVKYIAFTPPKRDQYFLEWMTGLRLSTFSPHSRALPASGSLTVGQNELVTGGALRGAVMRGDVFYPLSRHVQGLVGELYLFANFEYRLAGPANYPNYFLTPANPADTNPSNTYYITQNSKRDSYYIGVGVDLARLLSHIDLGIKLNK